MTGNIFLQRLDMLKIQIVAILISLTLKKSFSQDSALDTDDFQTFLLANSTELFVDKSLFVREFLDTKSSALLIVRPSGWGKSINLDMLRRFFQPEVDWKGDTRIKQQSTNGKLFLGGSVHLPHMNRTKHLKPLQISQDAAAMRLMGKHPVILVKMKKTSGDTYDGIVTQIKTRIKEAFEDHQYLLNSSRISIVQELGKYFGPVEKLAESDLHNCLYFLTWKLCEHFGQNIIVLVDDYDAPIINAYLKFGAKSKEFNKLLELVTTLYRTTLSFNPNLNKGLFCGSLKISLTNDTSMMFDISTLAHSKFSKWFGFTRTDLLNLLARSPSPELFDPKDMRLWYGGYQHRLDEDMFYYNSRSIMRYLRNNGTLLYYGQDSNRSTGLADKFLTSDNIQPKIHQLMSGQGLNFTSFTYTNPIRWNRISILEILYLNGYLRMIRLKFEDICNQHRLIIPNIEMEFFYATKVLQWVRGKFAVDVDQFYSLAETLPNADVDGFEKDLQRYLINAASYIASLDDEAKVFYVGLMIALQRALVSSHFTLMNDETKGVFSTEDEMLLVPKPNRSDTAIAINYKRVVTTMELMARASLEEIRSSQYADKLRAWNHTRKLIKIGAAFFRERLVVKYEFENITNHS